jgi:serine/threonine protein phosphatase PrpC
MRSGKDDNLQNVSPWRSTPPRYIAIFLLAVFCLFASIGIVTDSMDMGQQPALRFAFTVLLIGGFATCYAVSGITLRHRWWIAFLPLFTLQITCMHFLARLLPEGPALTQLDSAQLSSLRGRLTFDGVAVIISVVLGYVGFLIVSIAEARRRIRIELDKSTLDHELAAAREMQRIMVPEDLPPAPGYAIESIYRPAALVGGDFFQVTPLRCGQTLVVVGDVSGKGLSAAMIVSMLIGMLQTICAITDDPAQILNELNRMLFERKHGGFVTCLAVRLDPSGRVVLANAGHLPPWLNGNKVALAGSLPLSVVASITAEQETIEMRPGDRLTLLTDGVVEARNQQGELFGFDQTDALIRQGAALPALAEAAVEYGQEDDMTLISVVRAA